MASWISGSKSKYLIILAFSAIYLIWGSTYLAIRFSLETLPPFLMMGLRSVSAGGLLLAWAQFRGLGGITAVQWRSAVILGALFFVGGHGALAWGAERVPSGVAALSMAAVPVWTTLLQCLVHRIELPAWRLMLGLILGFGGVMILADPGKLLGGSSIDAGGLIAIQMGALSWSVGSVYSLKADLPPSSTLVAATSLTTGGTLLLVLSLASGEAVDLHAVTGRSLASLTYLVLCGSIIAFGAYTWLLEKTSPVRVSTCAFVNPVIAVVLGCVLAGESFDSRILNASLLMVIGVGAIVMRTQRRGHDEGSTVRQRICIETKEDFMIARVWRGRTPEDKADAYLDYLRKTGIKDHGETRGNRGDYIWKRVDDGVAEFWVISLWDSVEAIREFAGQQEDKAVYYPEDKEYLLELDPRVMHYEILHEPEC